MAELFLEREAQRGIVGNIYKGRVTRVLPGMQSAFVDLGLERDAFLHVADALDELPDNVLTAEEVSAARSAPIEERLHEGEERAWCRCSRSRSGTKGARITSHVSLPGRYLVLHADGRARRRLAQDHRRRRAAPAQDRAQGDPPGARRRRPDRAHRRPGPRGRRVRARRALPVAHLGRDARARRAPARAGAAAPRALARPAAAARPALRRRWPRSGSTTSATITAHARAGAGARARARAARAPAQRRGRDLRGARRRRRARARAALEGLAAGAAATS